MLCLKKWYFVSKKYLLGFAKNSVDKTAWRKRDVMYSKLMMGARKQVTGFIKDLSWLNIPLGIFKKLNFSVSLIHFEFPTQGHYNFRSLLFSWTFKEILAVSCFKIVLGCREVTENARWIPVAIMAEQNCVLINGIRTLLFLFQQMTYFSSFIVFELAY